MDRLRCENPGSQGTPVRIESPRRRPRRADRVSQDTVKEKSRYYRSMPFSVARCVAAIALLWLVASTADAQPAAVSPFPPGLSGTLAFQSDVTTPSNPN